MPRIIVIHDGTLREDVLEVEIWQETLLLTAQDNEQRDGVAVSILLDDRGVRLLRDHIDQYFEEYPRQQVTQLRERLENAEQEAREWKASAMVLSEGKDLLRRELDQATCQHQDHEDHLICQGCGECREDLNDEDYCPKCDPNSITCNCGEVIPKGPDGSWDDWNSHAQECHLWMPDLT